MARDDIDKVVVQLSSGPEYGRPTLEWVLDHFDMDKTMIILIPYYNHDVNKFQDVSESNYLLRCVEKKFRAEILIPDAQGNYKATMMELIINHGMNKFVTCARESSIRHISEIFDDKTWNLSCKIWFVSKGEGKLVLTRRYGPRKDEMIVNLKTVLKKETSRREEETSRREKVEKELISMTEQAKINEKEIDRLCHEIDQLKQDKALSTTFTFQELVQATQNFSDSLKIGEGEYGCVYKGTFRGTTVAMKKFKSQSMPDLSLLKQELVILSMVRHPNLITFIGACSEPPALVYEFLSRGSLHKYLNHAGSTTPLPWKIRTRIIGEVCVALIFLHLNKPKPLIHGDLRPDNILLDDNFTSKLSEFGLIKQVDTDIANSHPTRTLAYMDPEYLTTEKMTQESDVYSFGVLILHLLTGESRLNISRTVKETIGSDKFCTIVDESAGKWPLHHAEEVAKIGVWCADAHRSKRPDLVNDVWPIVERLVKFSNEIVHER